MCRAGAAGLPFRGAMLEALPPGVQEHVVRFLSIASKRALRGASRDMNAMVSRHMKFEGREVVDVLAEASAFVPDAENTRAYMLRCMKTFENYYDAARELVFRLEETFDSGAVCDAPIEGAVVGGSYDMAGVSRLATAQLLWTIGRAGTAAFCTADFDPLGPGGPVSVTAHKAEHADFVILVASRDKTEELCSMFVHGTASFYGGAPPQSVRVASVDPAWVVAMLAAMTRIRPPPAPPADVKFTTTRTFSQFIETPMFQLALALFPGWGLLTANPDHRNPYFVESVL